MSPLISEIPLADLFGDEALGPVPADAQVPGSPSSDLPHHEVGGDPLPGDDDAAQQGEFQIDPPAPGLAPGPLQIGCSRCRQGRNGCRTCNPNWTRTKGVVKRPAAAPMKRPAAAPMKRPAAAAAEKANKKPAPAPLDVPAPLENDNVPAPLDVVYGPELPPGFLGPAAAAVNADQPDEGVPAAEPAVDPEEPTVDGPPPQQEGPRDDLLDNYWD